MQLIPAEDFDAVKELYIDVISNTPRIGQYARWVYGQHPDDALLRWYMERGEMYVLTDGNRNAGAVAVVMHQDHDYETVPWTKALANDQVAALHMLAVSPDYRGKSVGKTIVEKAAEAALANGKKALRLDTLKTNLPAQRLYQRTGFTCVGGQSLFLENLGWLDFLYYEKILQDC